MRELRVEVGGCIWPGGGGGEVQQKKKRKKHNNQTLSEREKDDGGGDSDHQGRDEMRTTMRMTERGSTRDRQQNRTIVLSFIK